jgi:hypothetical protein
MPRLQAPCKDCPERTMYCHGKCEKYEEYRKQSKKNKEEYRKSLIWENYRDAMIKKTKRKQR